MCQFTVGASAGLVVGRGSQLRGGSTYNEAPLRRPKSKQGCNVSDTKDELQRKLEATSNVIGKVFFAIRDSIEEQHRDIGYLLDKLALHERIASALGDHLEDVLDAMNQGSG